MDSWLFGLIHGLAGHSPTIDRLMVGTATDLFKAIGIMTLIAGMANRQVGRPLVLRAAFSALLALGVAYLIQNLFPVPRPFVAHPDLVTPLVAFRTDPSFPSAFVAMAAGAAGTFLWARGRFSYWLLAVAVLLGFAEVYVGVNYSFDVFAALVIGLGIAYGVHRTNTPLDDWFQRRMI